MEMKNSPIAKKTINFLIAGVSANISSFVVFNGLILIMRLDIMISSILGQLAGIGISYFYNSRKTFKTRLSPLGKSAYVTYYVAAIWLTSCSINWLHRIGINIQLAWLFPVVIASVINYAILAGAVFIQKPSP